MAAAVLDLVFHAGLALLLGKGQADFTRVACRRLAVDSLPARVFLLLNRRPAPRSCSCSAELARNYGVRLASASMASRLSLRWPSQLMARPSASSGAVSLVSTEPLGISSASRAPRSQARRTGSSQFTCRAILVARLSRMRAGSDRERAALLLR